MNEIPIFHIENGRPDKIRAGASGRLTETETFRTTIRVASLQIVRSLLAYITLRADYVFLAETFRRDLIADIFSGTAGIAFADFAVRIGEVTRLAYVAGTTDYVPLTIARPR